MELFDSNDNNYIYSLNTDGTIQDASGNLVDPTTLPYHLPTDTPSNNARLGVFVAYRIAMSDLGPYEPRVRDQLRTMYPDAGIPDTGGAIHIGYAHLMDGSVQVQPSQSTEDTYLRGTVIATSGNTGGTSASGSYEGNRHLDVTVFFLFNEHVDARRYLTRGAFDGYTISHPTTDTVIPLYHYNGFYSMYYNAPANERVMLDPLDLWPTLVMMPDGTVICSSEDVLSECN